MTEYDQFINKLRDRTNIVDVVSAYVPLHRSGKNFLGLCPFHSEKTPSFTVSPEKNMFYCFGCQIGGDALTFLMKIENLSFPEAVELLAQKLGLTVPEKSPIKGEGEKGLYWKLYELACSFFEGMLQSPEGKTARDYLARRGIKEETWRAFRLGYAPSGNRLTELFKEKEISIPLFLRAGLGTEKDGGSDLFRQRLIFPIMDLRGRVIAFGGRALDESIPKYLNSGQTPLFEKSRHLYALHIAKRVIPERRTAIVVEGYMDALSAHQFGFKNTVASLGTALTPDQVRLLSRFSKRVILAYDADLAGVRATLRSFELFRSSEMEVRVASLGEHKDPDSLLQSRGAEAFTVSLARSISAFDFAYNKIARAYNWQVPEERRKAVQQILNFISSLSNILEQETYIKRLAIDAGLREDLLFQEMKRLSKEEPKGSSRAAVSLEEAEIVLKKPPGAEERLLHLLLHYPELLIEFKEEIDPSDFRDPSLGQMLEEMLACLAQGKWGNNIQFSFKPERMNLVSRLIMNKIAVENPGEETRSCLSRIKKEKISRDIRRLKEEMPLLEKAGEEHLLKEKLRELQKLREWKEQIDNSWRKKD